MGTKLTNNATGRLAVSLTAASTQLSMVVGDAVKFPTIAAGSGDNFPLTAVKANGELEIMLCTLTNGNVFTVQRGQEGTSPKAFSAGDRIELRLTAGTIDGMIDDRIEVALEDLGSAAKKDVGTSSGQLMEVGAGGWLGAAFPGSYIDGYPQSISQNISQVYRRESNDLGVTPHCSSIHFAADDTWGRLRVDYYSPRAWIQGGVAATGTGWTAELYHSENKPNWSDINEKPNLVETSRTITAGTGLTGGGTLADNRTLSVNFGTAADTAAQGNDSRIEGAAQKSNNLSDLTNAATARDNLGLGNAATRNVGTSNGQLMEVGAFGLGGLEANHNLENKSYFATFGPSTLPTNYPSGEYDYGAILSIAHGYPGANMDMVFTHTYNSKIFYRYARNGPWREIYHSGAPPSWNSIEGKPSTFTPPTEHGGVGTYAWVSYRPSNPSKIYWGDTIAGSSINPDGGDLGPALAGTWRVMGGSLGIEKLPRGQPENAILNLAVRIS